tara:strand:+ start:1419 stop:2429 length:1011 start_codon:yes stop_codon:yes gene_type:complete
MATTQLADVYVPLTFNRRAQEAQIAKNAFLASGVAVADATLGQQFAAGGNIAELPQYNGITHGEPNYSSDDNTSSATASKITSKKQIARSAHRNEHWSTMDLSRELALEDPMGAITDSVGGYWASDDEQRIIRSCAGILANNDAADSDDMVNKLATDAVGAITDAERISATAIMTAEQTMGDAKTKLTAIAMHSLQQHRLRLQGLIVDNIDPASGSLLYSTYLGKRVIVDDSLFTIAGTNRITYQVILFGPGAFSFAAGPVQTPSELTRNALVGDGGGETILSSRVNTIYHPNGFQCLAAGVAATTATYAELAAAAAWDRVVSRKNISLAFLTVND